MSAKCCCCLFPGRYWEQASDCAHLLLSFLPALPTTNNLLCSPKTAAAVACKQVQASIPGGQHAGPPV